MKFIDKVCDKLGLFNDDDLKDTVEETGVIKEVPKPEPPKPEAQVKPAFEAVKPPTHVPHFGSKVVDFNSAIERRENAMNRKAEKIKLDAQIVANCLRERVPVIINFEQTDPKDAARIIDFISGTTYALNGDIKKINDQVFICAPNNVNVSAADDDKKTTTSMPWLNK